VSRRHEVMHEEVRGRFWRSKAVSIDAMTGLPECPKTKGAAPIQLDAICVPEVESTEKDKKANSTKKSMKESEGGLSYRKVTECVCLS
jgi:hypothetical protein